MRGRWSIDKIPSGNIAVWNQPGSSLRDQGEAMSVYRQRKGGFSVPHPLTYPHKSSWIDRRLKPYDQSLPRSDSGSHSPIIRVMAPNPTSYPSKMRFYLILTQEHLLDRHSLRQMLRST